MSCEILPTASSSRRAALASTSTTPGGAACSAPSSADSSPVVGRRKCDNNQLKIIILPTDHLLRWPVLRRHVLMDAAAAALDARRLQTYANTGDCAAWVNKNPGVGERCGTNALLITAMDQQTRGTHNNSSDVGQITRKTRHTTASAPRGRPTLRDAMSPSEAQPPQPALHCRLRHTKRRRDFLAAEPSRRHALHGETLLCGSHHVVM